MQWEGCAVCYIRGLLKCAGWTTLSEASATPRPSRNQDSGHAEPFAPLEGKLREASAFGLAGGEKSRFLVALGSTAPKSSRLDENKRRLEQQEQVQSHESRFLPTKIDESRGRDGLAHTTDS